MAALGHNMEVVTSVRVLFALASNYIPPEGIRNKETVPSRTHLPNIVKHVSTWGCTQVSIELLVADHALLNRRSHGIVAP